MPTLNERIQALSAASDSVHKALKLATFYRGATANPPTIFLAFEGDPDARVQVTPEMRQQLIDAAVAKITEAEGFLETAKQGL